MSALRALVSEEHPGQPKAEQDYVERLYQSGFRDTLQRRAEQFGQRAADIDFFRQTERRVDELAEYFIVRHCVDLNEVPWSEAVLKYQGFSWPEIDLFQMSLDYLDFARESEEVYTDFLQMPMDKLRNAGQSFLFPEKKERILLICDHSIMGSCKEGFALTERGLYWKAHLAKAQRVFFADLREVKREQEWIEINGHFFNANSALNVKMMRLLKTIKRII